MDFLSEIIQNIVVFVEQIGSIILTAITEMEEFFGGDFFTLFLIFFLGTVTLLFCTILTIRLGRKYQTKLAKLAKPTTLTILAILMLAFFSYNLPQKYQLANLTNQSENTTDANQIGGNQGLINQTPTSVLGETTQETLSLLAESNPNLYQLLTTDAQRRGSASSLQLGMLSINPQGQLFILPKSISSREIKNHEVKNQDMADNSITSTNIKNHTIRSIDLQRELTIEELKINQNLTVRGNLTTQGSLTAVDMNLSGNLDLQDNLILNIGNTSTDFTTTGGLNLAGNLNINNNFLANATTGNITAGTYNGNTITSGTGTLTLNEHTLTLTNNSQLNQNLLTTSTPQFTRLGLGISTDTTNILTATSSSTTDLSKTLNISHTGIITGTGYAGYFSKTGASITNVGLYTIATGATNNYALQVDSAVVGATNYTIYANGVAKNYFAGNIGIGDAAPGTNLSVIGNAQIGYVSGTTVSAGTSLAISGNVGIGTTGPLAKLQVGGLNANNSVDSQILISRNVDNTVAGNGHAFSDSSNVNRSGTIGYNSYDARINYSGSYDYDHYAGFQFGPVYGSSGTITNFTGFVNVPTISSGTVVNSRGLWVYNPSGAGSVTNNYGIYVDSLTKGTSSNYAIYTANSTPNYLGGNTTIDTGSSNTTLTVGSQGSAGRESIINQLGKSSGGTAINATWTLANSGWYTLSTQSVANVIQIGTVTGGVGIGYADPGTAKLAINGNVGIGTTAPDNNLEVATTGNLKGITINGTGSAANTGLTIKSKYSSSTYSYGLMVTNDNSGYGANKLIIGEGTNPSFVLNSSGNVGIGTTSPGQKLEINSQAMRIFPSGAAGYGAYLGNDNASVYLAYNNFVNTTWQNDATTGASNMLYMNGDFNFYTRAAAATAGIGTSKVTILNSGNVGIGSTAPGARLQVVGADDVSTNFAAKLGGATTTGLVITNAGNVGIGTTGPGSLLHVNGAVNGTIAKLGTTRNTIGDVVDLEFLVNTNQIGAKLGLVYEGSWDTGMAFYTRTAEGEGIQERFRIQHNGNVGIGTTAPTSKLSFGTGSTISTATSDASDNDVLSIAGGGIAGRTRGASIYLYGNEHASTGQLILEAGDITGGNMLFKVNGGIPMSIYQAGSVANTLVLNSGNVGIGTTNPEDKLTVLGGGGQIYTLGQYGLTRGDGNDDSTALRLNYVGYQLGTTRYRDLAVGDGKQNTILFVDGSGGNVGIGTTGPLAPLTVSKTLSTATTLLQLDNATNAFVNSNLDFTVVNGTIAAARIAMVYPGANDASLAFSTYGTSPSTGLFERMRITNNGNVGIGTTGPGSLLEIKKVSIDGITVDLSNDYNMMVMKVAGTKKWSYRVNGNDLRFYDETNGSDKVTF